MAKKTARPSNTKPSQQRSKEEQWRKRMAAQARVAGTDFAPTNGTGSAVAETDEDVLGETTATERIAPAASTAARTTATRAQATPATRSASTAAAMRRPTPPRGRLAQANAMTIEEEMHFVRRDIRKLVILTAICLAIIIILAFIVPSFVK